MRYINHRVLCLFVMLPVSMAASGAGFTLNIADINAPDFAARGIRVSLPDNGSADLLISKLTVRQREFFNVHLRCAELTLTSAQMHCRSGHLDAMPDAALDINYLFATKRLHLSLTAAGAESWQLDGQPGERGGQFTVQLRNAQSRRIAPLLPPELSLPTQGRFNGSLRISASGAQADMQLSDVAFSDASGLHAAEKLRGTVKFSAKRSAADWTWQGDVVWQSGELFWQPLYLRGGHRLSASGRFDGHTLRVDQAAADLPQVGRVQFSAGWDWQHDSLLEGTLRGDTLALDKLFSGYAQPFLGKGVLAESVMSGHADVAAEYRNGALQSLHLNLHDAGIFDVARRFAWLGVNSETDWYRDKASTAQIDFSGGALLGVPLGKGQWLVRMRGMEFDVPQASLPVLDGRLDLRDFHLHRQADAWHWHFAGVLAPISMEQLSVAAGWPKMLGSLAGRIPDVSYDGGEIRADGALLFNLFDGTVVATQLKLSDAFGRVPRLSGNLTMRNLDLDLLTRTFSFGNMQGRLDVDVNNLQLQDWQPLSFDARLYSSAGNYPRKISQKAVQNISSLGGAGAAAALQRSYLSFFGNFGYERIGLSCVLRNNVCAMGGIDPQYYGAYAIIKGGGIPAISVMGYNRAVSWGELITRLKRVTQDNVTPIVK